MRHVSQTEDGHSGRRKRSRIDVHNFPRNLQYTGVRSCNTEIEDHRHQTNREVADVWAVRQRADRWDAVSAPSAASRSRMCLSAHATGKDARSAGRQ